MPEKIEATYRIVTPMFIGDAEQNATGISPASVKGALRFWWRALNWSKIRENTKSNEEGLCELHRQEGKLFGSAADNGPGQGQFMLRVATQRLKMGNPPAPKSGTQYLLGQGLYHFKNNYLRSAILQGELSIQCILKPSILEESESQITEAILALGLLGGLGSRSRKGFGSLSIQSLSINGNHADIPNNLEEYKQVISRWQDNAATPFPPITAFSKESRIDVSFSDGVPEQLLNDVGEELQLYRSWGRNKKVNGKNAEQNFKSDHDEVLDIAGGTSPKRLPKRSVFGMPHNYFYSSSNQKVDITPADGSRTRRASPLFIHAHQFPDNSSALIQSLLPATYLSSGDKIEFKPGRGRAKTIEINHDRDIDWTVIHKYMDRFNQKENKA